MRVRVDESGNRYGKLTVVRHSPVSVIDIWQCRCECGTLCNVTGDLLRRGRGKSCGCGRKPHGNAVRSGESPEYRCWSHMLDRCRRATDRRFADYGGRGITVCERWNTFSNFLEDMGSRPSPSHSLDRINNDGNYEPGNCRWATIREQRNNTRANRILTLNGESKNLTQWSHSLGIGYKTLLWRLAKGWSDERTLSTPSHTYHKKERAVK